MQSNSMTKVCGICKQRLPLDTFYQLLNRNGKRYPHPYCKPCGKQKRRDYPQAKASKEDVRRRNLRPYGITVEEYDRLFAAQNGMCAICRKPEIHISPYTQSTRRLCVDHDHRTGAIRGLLCSRCNRAIGFFDDDLAGIRNVVTYLEHSSQTHEG